MAVAPGDPKGSPGTGVHERRSPGSGRLNSSIAPMGLWRRGGPIPRTWPSPAYLPVRQAGPASWATSKRAYGTQDIAAADRELPRLPANCRPDFHSSRVNPRIMINCSENNLPVPKAFRSNPDYRGHLWSAVPIPMYIRTLVCPPKDARKPKRRHPDVHRDRTP